MNDRGSDDHPAEPDHDDGPRVTPLAVGSNKLVVISVPIDLGPALDGLTPAEIDVCEGLLAGLSDSEIAAERGTSPSTIANQVASIFGKLGVHSRAELVVVLEQGNRG